MSSMRRLTNPLFLWLALTTVTSVAYSQPWLSVLDSSRAIDWSTAGFTIPNYTVACATQPSLASGCGSASANSTAINNAIASCDAAHNVVNIPTGTFYVAGINYGGKSNVVLRGAGPMNTYVYLTAGTSCGGYVGVGVCMAGGSLYAQSNTVLPGGQTVCNWTAGYTKGTSSITLNSCGSAPPVGQILVLDQADDGADNGGIWLCSGYDSAASPPCQQNGANQNADGRVINGVQYSEQQETRITGVTGSGSGPYTVTINPPLYFNNIRSSQSPGAWWSSTNMSSSGIEGMTLDHSLDTSSNIGGLMIWCYQCWFRNMRSLYGGVTNHWDMVSDLQPVVRDSYFYGSQHGGSEAYCVQMLEVSGGLVENNIMQNTISPDIKDAVTGSVSSYNFTPDISFGNYMQGLYASHNSGSAFNLLEGNATTEFLGDNVWGTSVLMTIFRNRATGWQPGYTKQTFAFSLNNGVRGVNIIGNVLGQAGYHTQYQAYATSATAGVFQTKFGGALTAGSGTINQTIYELGWTDEAGLGVCNSGIACDPLVYGTMMRWGNYDVVNNAVQWNTAEASPAAVPYLNANAAPTTHTLPVSFYLAAKPAFFGSVPFPAIGPDVSAGSLGQCTSGTYSGSGALSASQCSGGSFAASAVSGFVNANPAQICYLNVMGGPPDGTGGILSFDANTCYYSSGSGGTGNGPGAPPSLSGTWK